jgi:hypothetical protein
LHRKIVEIVVAAGTGCFDMMAVPAARGGVVQSYRIIQRQAQIDDLASAHQQARPSHLIGAQQVDGANLVAIAKRTPGVLFFGFTNLRKLRKFG